MHGPLANVTGVRSSKSTITIYSSYRGRNICSTRAGNGGSNGSSSIISNGDSDGGSNSSSKGGDNLDRTTHLGQWSALQCTN